MLVFELFWWWWWQVLVIRHHELEQNWKIQKKSGGCVLMSRPYSIADLDGLFAAAGADDDLDSVEQARRLAA